MFIWNGTCYQDDYVKRISVMITSNQKLFDLLLSK